VPWLQGVRVVLTDGAAHAVDSSELAFKLASMFAFRCGWLGGWLFLPSMPACPTPAASDAGPSPADADGNFLMCALQAGVRQGSAHNHGANHECGGELWGCEE
jgi:hypothetical protein